MKKKYANIFLHAILEKQILCFWLFNLNYQCKSHKSKVKYILIIIINC